MMTVALPAFTPTCTVYQTACAAVRAGISFIPILGDGTKSPAIRWKDFQQKRPTLHEARTWFHRKEWGIAFLTGAISGGLEMLDFDARSVYAEFLVCMQQEGLGWLIEHIAQGYQELSPSGVHLYYRCTWMEGNKKLAQCPLQEPPWVMSKIETRGEGGYSIGAPSGGGVHPSGQSYQLVQGALATIQTITPEERALLLSVARSLDEMPPPRKAVTSKETRRSYGRTQAMTGKRLPGHIFNARGPSWAQILEPHGCTWVKRIGSEDFWRRPGKNHGVSATTNYEKGDRLYVFSTSTLFEPRVAISKFAAYTFLEHQGDFAASARALAAQGYVA